QGGAQPRARRRPPLRAGGRRLARRDDLGMRAEAPRRAGSAGEGMAGGAVTALRPASGRPGFSRRRRSARASQELTTENTDNTDAAALHVVSEVSTLSVLSVAPKTAFPKPRGRGGERGGVPDPLTEPGV